MACSTHIRRAGRGRFAGCSARRHSFNAGEQKYRSFDSQEDGVRVENMAGRFLKMAWAGCGKLVPQATTDTALTTRAAAATVDALEEQRNLENRRQGWRYSLYSHVSQ